MALPPRIKDYITKILIPDEKPSFELLPLAVFETPKIYRLLLLPLVTLISRLKLSPHCLRHHALQK